MLYLEADYAPNSSLSRTQKSNNHDEINTRIKTAAATSSLHLNNMNLDNLDSFGDLFKLTSLVRLDLSYNNLVRLDERIGLLVNMKQLWLNNNPLREVPVALQNCVKLREIDLRQTFIISLP